jgi:D-alanyl-D-alanine carboxypeptidase
VLFDELRLTTVEVVTTPSEFAKMAWGNPQSYDPGWVYHGLLMGTPVDAANFLHKLMSSAVLSPPLLEQMLIPHPLGRPIADRPWLTAAYGLGLMIGELKDAGMAIGHSGGAPAASLPFIIFPNELFPAPSRLLPTAMPPVPQNLKWPDWPAACKIGSRRSVVNN